MTKNKLVDVSQCFGKVYASSFQSDFMFFLQMKETMIEKFKQCKKDNCFVLLIVCVSLRRLHYRCQWRNKTTKLWRHWAKSMKARNHEVTNPHSHELYFFLTRQNAYRIHIYIYTTSSGTVEMFFWSKNTSKLVSANILQGCKN